MFKITIEDGTNPAKVLTIPEDVMTSLEAYRVERCHWVPELKKQVPLHGSVVAMASHHLMQDFVRPALERFPTPAIAAAKAQADAAAQALLDAHANATGLKL